jgi:hypothetical protein
MPEYPTALSNLAGYLGFILYLMCSLQCPVHRRPIHPSTLRCITLITVHYITQLTLQLHGACANCVDQGCSDGLQVTVH